MNHLNFNYEVTPSDFCGWGMSNSVAAAPLFIGTDAEDVQLLKDDNHAFLDEVAHNEKLLPFAQMRIFLRSNSSDSRDGTTGFKMWVEHKARCLFLVSCLTHRLERIHIPAVLFLKSNVDSHACNFIARRGNSILKHPPDVVCDIGIGILTSLRFFLSELNSPSNFIAQVRPNKQGKSVEWTTARTHYVVLHKSHPANKKELQPGSPVTEDNRYLKRQAHSRRAHFRILRSDRFRHKLGQMIRVKSCWVGPNEWQQSGSIYRIHEPTKSMINQSEQAKILTK